jgi:hypothetical protein
MWAKVLENQGKMQRGERVQFEEGREAREEKVRDVYVKKPVMYG